MTGRAGYGATVELILWALREYGPMTRAEIERAIGKDHRTVSAVVSRMAKRGPASAKRVYILEYRHEDDEVAGKRRYPRAVFALGDNPDAKRPKPDVAANKRRYNQGKKAHLLMNSVFNLGKTRSQVRAEGHYL